MEQNNPFCLGGKQILVTGASSGIGRAIAIACAGMGATVYITGRNQERLEDTMSLLPGNNHKIIPADLTKADCINALVSALPRLDGIVHSAGVCRQTLCKDVNEEAIDYTFKVNFEAPVLLQSQILSEKKINKGCSVVFIASKAAEFPAVGNALYSASKGAIISYARCLSKELAARQIRVNSICPAMVWTDLILHSGLTKEDLEEAQLKYPLKRYGQPEDIAHLAVYLLSDASSWMTGSAIDITGGALQL